MFHSSFLKLEKADFEQMHSTVLDTPPPQLEDDRGIKVNTENCPTVRAIKLTLQDANSGTTLKNLNHSLNQKWGSFSPATRHHNKLNEG